MAYVTIEEVMQEMDILSEDVDEVLLQRKIDSAQNIIENVTNRRFEASADETRLIDCIEGETVDGRTLFIPYDICEITTILNGDEDNTEVTVDEYVTEPRLRTVSGGSSVMPAVHDAWPWYAVRLKFSANKSWDYTDDQEEAISITGRWAFSITPPAAIKDATIRLSDWLYHQKDNLDDREENTTGTDGILLMMSDLPSDVQSRLMRYVRTV